MVVVVEDEEMVEEVVQESDEDMVDECTRK